MEKDNWPWRFPAKPQLTKSGQVIFWNRQSESYDQCDLTNGNPLEMRAVINFFKQRAIGEIIVFGGATGCRDPLLILKKAYCQNCLRCGSNRLPAVIFNDLSPRLAKHAKDQELRRCRIEGGAKLSFKTGRVKDVCRLIKPEPRALLMGVYDIDSFFAPVAHFPQSGFSEYLEQASVLGDFFWFDLIDYRCGRLEFSPLGRFPAAASPVKDVFLPEFRTRYRRAKKKHSLGLRVTSVKKGQSGYFISDWYEQKSFAGFLKDFFPPDLFSISVRRCAKGDLYLVENRQTETTRAITLLNNVFGNIRPSEQINTLKAIRRIMRPA
jgi:hypothetical protein